VRVASRRAPQTQLPRPPTGKTRPSGVDDLRDTAARTRRVGKKLNRDETLVSGPAVPGVSGFNHDETLMTRPLISELGRYRAVRSFEHTLQREQPAPAAAAAVPRHVGTPPFA
jgi:endonuclease/exonuclease/phosphatase (EEP) superfamily protein YafD